MLRLSSVLVLTASLVLAADPPALKDKPITTAGGEAGDLLRKWWKEGTAAGNVGDWYDNRDRGHSDLDTNAYPQLRRFVYSDDDLKQRRDWAAAGVLRTDVTFGNSSTSAPPTLTGSNPRSLYLHPRGLPLLYEQYTHANLYIYPEHRDHDPGHNGMGDGYGDLYPTNTPYLLISQGSSGSDQPFMHAVPQTLAAFRPEVKKKLIESGLLMPTVQMILRHTNKHLAGPEEYMTGKAHPSVFEGSWVDPARMVKLAHEIEAGAIPPMVQLKVLEEESPLPGRDFFDPVGNERLANTPAVIARVWRGAAGRRRLVVSATDSFDVNKRPLKFHWVVLRGDAGRIDIRPENADGSVVEVVVPYHPRRPVAPGSPLESNRVDIGVFVHNGVYPSAPGFLTFCSLDSEARTYADDGRVLEIGYGMGETTLNVRDWNGLFAALQADTPAGRLPRLTDTERTALREAAPAYKKLHDAQQAAQEKRKSAEAEAQKAAAAQKTAQERKAAAAKAHADKPSPQTKAALDQVTEEETARTRDRTKADDTLRAAQKEADEAGKAVSTFLDTKIPQCDAGPRALVERALTELIRDPEFCNRHADTIAGLLSKADGGRKGAVEGERRRLIGLGVASGMKGNRLDLRPGKWTDYEKAQLERFGAAVLANLVYPGVVDHSYQVNFVDGRLTAPKTWRDVYRYDAKGRPLGWTRYDGETETDFNPDGLMVLSTDLRGRCVLARTVRYEQAPPPAGHFGFNANPLRCLPSGEFLTYAYDGEDDVKGYVVTREPAEKK